MKTALYIVEGRTQIVLTPQNPHETAIVKMIQEGKEFATYAGSFYECQGGWTRNGIGDESAILIIKDKQ